MSDATPNPWKWMTIGLGGVMAVILLGGIVIASLDRPDETPAVSAAETAAESKVVNTKVAETKPAAPKPAPVRVASAPPPAPAAPPRPTPDDVAACNSYAASVRTQTHEVLRDGVLGGALGAGVGAASGAIADGGKGAGRGAGIGAIVGVTAGSLYGLNRKNQDDARSEQAYRQCMAQRGF